MKEKTEGLNAMQKIKYGVWFHGTKYEKEGLCYCGRNPFVSDTEEQALKHKESLEFSCDEPNSFSICTIVINEVQE